MLNLSKLAKTPNQFEKMQEYLSKSNYHICDSNWQKKIIRKKMFSNFVNKCHENWKIKTTHHCLITCKIRIKSQDLFKKHQNGSKTDQNGSKIVISQILVSPPQIICIFLMSENHFGVLKKRTSGGWCQENKSGSSNRWPYLRSKNICKEDDWKKKERRLLPIFHTRCRYSTQHLFWVVT